MPGTSAFAVQPYNRTRVPGFDNSLPSWIGNELLRVQGAIRPAVSTPVQSSGGANNGTPLAPYVIRVTDGMIVADTTAGNIGLQLPLAALVQEMVVTVKKVDSAANTVFITPSGTDTIDGAGVASITRQWATVTLRSNGATWYASVSPSIPAPSTVGTLTFGTHLTGGSFNGSANVTIATDATSSNTVSTIVARDGSGNFSAGLITGNTGFSVPNGTYYNATRNTGGSSINILGFDTGTDDLYLRTGGATTGSKTVIRDTNNFDLLTILNNTGAATFRSSVTATTLTGTLSTAAQPNVTSLGTLTGLTVSGLLNAQGSVLFSGAAPAAGSSAIGSNGSGRLLYNVATGQEHDFQVNGSTVAFVVGSGLGATLVTAAQPNVTSVGTLTSLTVANTVAIGPSSPINALQLTGDSVGNGMQIKMGSSNVVNVVGTTYSGGYNFMAANAYQTTAANDSWTQAFASVRSLLYVQDYTLGHVWYNAAAGVSPANKATFWGSPLMSISPAGAVAMSSTLAVTGIATFGTTVNMAASAQQVWSGQGSLQFNASGSFRLLDSGGTPYGTWSTAGIRVSNLGVGNSAAATIAVGTLTRKMEVFDASGSSLGFVPIYATIT